MGFIENLRRQKIEAEATIEAERQLAIRIKADEEKRHREEAPKRAQNFQLALEARRQFDESGVKDLVVQLLDIKRNLIFEEADQFDNYTSLAKNPDNYFGGGHYYSRIVLNPGDVRDVRHGLPYVVRYIGIETTSDGTIRFIGGKNGCSIINKKKWNNNKNFLEEALGKAYRDPSSVEYKPAGPTGGPGM